MGFDAVDKKFRKPPPIRLECVDCGTTDDVRMTDIDKYKLKPSEPLPHEALCQKCRVYFYCHGERRKVKKAP